MNKQKQHKPHSSQELDARVTRFGLRVAAGLTERSNDIPVDVSERLRFAREQAMAKAQAARKTETATARPSVFRTGGATLALGGAGRPSRWFKFASALPLLALVAGLLAIQVGQWQQQVNAAADIDTRLLSDNLPPAAYSDPGFSEYLSDEQE
ncbi:DUF3619 family protein [Pelomonas sp. KK5]|uniref:DUF3619 family protein n=1 Tax=Pelomonas sp. KK5 TaxID=1855730 RepID=UPI00097C360C|nr:DUF3619 family protein [Pelomonas sp. KK5]